MAKPLNVGLIGYGFMGRAHSNAYRKVTHFFNLDYHPVLKAVCARSRDKAQAFANQWGYESVETDWRKLVERPDIDLIDICTPNNTHAEIAIAAAQAGKWILCEKPLAMNGPEGLRMVEASYRYRQRVYGSNHPFTREARGIRGAINLIGNSPATAMLAASIAANGSTSIHPLLSCSDKGVAPRNATMPRKAPQVAGRINC